MYKIRLTAVASITAIITLAITVIGSQPIEKYSAELTIECENSEIHIDSIQYLSIKATIFNNGNELIKLVRPGDGSQGGLRTPIVNWSVIKSNNEQNENVKKTISLSGWCQ